MMFSELNSSLTNCNSVAGVTLYGGPRATSLLNIPEATSFSHEYTSKACTVEVVDDINAAIDHIHKYGRHVDSFFSFFVCICILISQS